MSREALGSHTVDSASDKPLRSAWGFQDPREPAVFGLLERTLFVSESFLNKNEGGMRIDNPRIHLYLWLLRNSAEILLKSTMCPSWARWTKLAEINRTPSLNPERECEGVRKGPRIGVWGEGISSHVLTDCQAPQSPANYGGFQTHTYIYEPSESYGSEGHQLPFLNSTLWDSG